MLHNKECLFCNIIAKKIPSTIRYENEAVIAFNDIHPQAPTHILIIPKTHIPSVNELKDTDGDLVGKLVLAAQKLAQEEGIKETGYRLVFNTRDHGGQVVDHIHLHLIGGKKLGSMA